MDYFETASSSERMKIAIKLVSLWLAYQIVSAAPNISIEEDRFTAPFNISEFHADLVVNPAKSVKLNRRALFKSWVKNLSLNTELYSEVSCSTAEELFILSKIASVFWSHDIIHESLRIANTINKYITRLLNDMTRGVFIDCPAVIMDCALTLSMLLAETGDWNQGYSIVISVNTWCSNSRKQNINGLNSEFHSLCNKAVAQMILYSILALPSCSIDGEILAGGLLKLLDINKITGSDFAPFENHPVFWLLTSELQYLIKYHGIKNIVRYLTELRVANALIFCCGSSESDLISLSGSWCRSSFCRERSNSDIVGNCSTSCKSRADRSDLMDVFQKKIYHELRTTLDFPARISNANYLTAFMKHLKEMHSKMSVFLDEYGAFSVSQRHHTASLLLSYSSIHSTNLKHFLKHNCSIKPALAASILDSESEGDIVKFIAISCLFPRGVAATPPILSGFTELRQYRDQQLVDAQCMSSLLADAEMIKVSKMKSREISKTIFEEEMFENHVTNTPASMMIGYDVISDEKNSEPDLSSILLLKTSNEASKYCAKMKYWEEQTVSFSDFQLLKSQKLSVSNLDSRIRVAFISSFLFDHSVGRLIAPTILSLNRSIFQVSAVCVGCNEYAPNADYPDKITDELHLGCEKWIDLSAKTKGHWVKILQSESFDVIIFPELGMDKDTLMLSHFRMADLQLVYWGHPISQFQDTIDYYLSSDLFEVNLTRSNMMLHR